jgi:hypothetical protein
MYSWLFKTYERLDPWLHRVLIALTLLLWSLSGFAPKWLHTVNPIREVLEWSSQLIEMLVKIFGFLAAVAWGFRFLVRRYGHQTPPVVSAFLKLPDYMSDQQKSWKPHFSMRRVRSVNDKPDSDDIELFVRLSSDELPIAQAHLELSDDERRAVYKTWWRTNPDSFLILELHEEGLPTDVVAVSIVLPLTRQGAKTFLHHRSSALKLEEADIAPAGRHPENLLIDTWIVASDYRRSYDRYRYSLLLRHLALFWRSKDRDTEIFAEPDTVRMAKHLSDLGFAKVERREGADLYRLRIADRALPTPKEVAINLIVKNIQAIAQWPLEELPRT